eukprot:Pgem_evm2s531
MLVITVFKYTKGQWLSGIGGKIPIIGEGKDSRFSGLTLYVPDSPVELISCNQARKEGYNVLFRSDGLVLIYKNGDVSTIIGEVRNGMYEYDYNGCYVVTRSNNEDNKLNSDNYNYNSNISLDNIIQRN